MSFLFDTYVSMTYMSLVLEVQYWCDNGRLVLLRPASGDPIGRVVCLSLDLAGMIFGPWPSSGEAIRWTALRADLDNFVEGRRVVAVANHPFKGGKGADLKRLYKERDEVWEWRCRHPSPGLRVFGRFPSKDILVALGWADRAELGGPWDPNRKGRQSAEWRNAKLKCKTDWRNLFPAYNPFTASTLYGCVSNIFLV
jgi:hypothetical protein